MHQLRRQVRQAQRRLAWQQFLAALVWCWFGTLLVAVVGLSVTKIWPLDIDGRTWAAAWVGGAVLVGLLAAAGWTIWRRQTSLDAALELDRRFGLKERVSSALALSAAEQETEAGRALVADAQRRTQRIDVAERFGLVMSRRAWLPVLPAAIVLILCVAVSDKTTEQAAAAAEPAEVRQQIQRSTDILERKLAERRKSAQDENLKDAEQLFQKIEDRVRDLAKQQQVDRQQTLVKLNDLAQDLADRRQQLGAEQLKQQLEQLKDLKEHGPADKLAQAMKRGDFQKALNEVKQLERQLERQDLTPQDKEQLAAQLNEMKDRLQQQIAAHDQVKQQLEQQLNQAKSAGNAAEADKAQQQLDKLQRQANQMNRLGQLSNKLGQAGEALKQGKQAGAQQALDQLAGDLKEMQQASDEIQQLDVAMDQIADAKAAMNCKACQGAGCKECQGGLEGGDKDFAKGRGEGGRGQRGEEKTDTGLYDSKVDQNVRRGSGVVTDLVQGPNVKGNVQQEIKAEIEAAARQPADPLTGQTLPRHEREHAQQYFDSLREGP